MEKFIIDLDDKQKAKEQVAKIQKSIDDLLIVCKEQETMLKKNAQELADAAKALKNMTDTAIDFADALKNINRVLLSKKELWESDKEMTELCNTLSKFIISSSSIKLGVMSNAREQNASE